MNTAKIGTYQGQAGDFVAWAELADSTKEDRLRQGYTENAPGLRSGEMRDSIEITVEMKLGAGGEAHIGSDDEKLVFFELGTVKQYPRSVLGGALFRKATKVRDIIGDGVYGALIGEEVHNQAIEILSE